MSYNFGIENKLVIQERNKKKREKKKEKKKKHMTKNQ